MKRILLLLTAVVCLICPTEHGSSICVISSQIDASQSSINSKEIVKNLELSQTSTHILINEFCVAPTSGEFIEIYNPSEQDIDLTDYYLTDAISHNDNDYVNLVDSSYTAFGSDFLSRFPVNQKIVPNGCLVIAMDGEAFNETYGFYPDLEIKGTSDLVVDMIEPLPGSIGKAAGISNAGECILLFHWDGNTDLVSDVDYVVWGDKDEAIDKSKTQKDGPDLDEVTSMYANDTPISEQIPISTNAPHSSGKSVSRISPTEVNETLDSGNGINGHDETSENLKKAFIETDPSPGEQAHSSSVDVIFRCNACIWPDTLSSHGILQIRGTRISDDGPEMDDTTIDTLGPGNILHWNGKSTMTLSNIDGDYWEGKFSLPRDMRIAYKFYANSEHHTVQRGDEWEYSYLEFDLAADDHTNTGNRVLDLTSCSRPDTVLPMQYLNGRRDHYISQYERPFNDDPDSIDLLFRVNMAESDIFDPAAHNIGIRGHYMNSMESPNAFSWFKTEYMIKESTDFNNNQFYYVPIKIPFTMVDSLLILKVVISKTEQCDTVNWSEMPYVLNKEYIVHIPDSDSTLHWNLFDDNYLISSIPPLQKKQDHSLNLYQNYPNPVNATTFIKFELDKSSYVTLKIFNLMGEEISTLLAEHISAGEHKTLWNCRETDDSRVSSGIYLYQLRTDRHSCIKKMIILK